MTDEQPPLQGGMTNDELRAAWYKKLPGVVPKDLELSAFALGVEVGYAAAVARERAKWADLLQANAQQCNSEITRAILESRAAAIRGDA